MTVLKLLGLYFVIISIAKFAVYTILRRRENANR